MRPVRQVSLVRRPHPSAAGAAPPVRASARSAGRRITAPLAVLFAVLLALLPTNTGSAQADPVRGAATGSSAPGVHGPTVYADNPWTPDSWAQVRARYDHLAERPALPSPSPDHRLAEHGGTGPVPCARTYGPAPRACPPASPGRTAHDQGRAPPARTGS